MPYSYGKGGNRWEKSAPGGNNSPTKVVGPKSGNTSFHNYEPTYKEMRDKKYMSGKYGYK